MCRRRVPVSGFHDEIGDGFVGMSAVFVIGFLQPDLEGRGSDIAESHCCWITAIEGGIRDDDDRVGVGVV